MSKPKKPFASIDHTSLISAQVTASHGRHHFVTTSDGSVFEAHRRGKKGDVVVGDYVRITPPVSGIAAIESIESRRTLLFRSDEWRIKELASNVDLVAIVYASRPTFNPWFIWRALIAAKTAGVDCLVIRNKTDLSEGAQAAQALLDEQAALGEEVVAVSAGSDPEKTKSLLTERFQGKTVLLVGQSGMGKSTILNVLIPWAQARTREFSEALDLGKQTTTATHLYRTADFALIDSPGFQEFGLAHVTAVDIQRAMPDIAGAINGCRFYNCTHTHEPGCSVLQALKEEKIAPARFEFYRETLRQTQN